MTPEQNPHETRGGARPVVGIDEDPHQADGRSCTSVLRFGLNRQVVCKCGWRSPELMEPLRRERNQRTPDEQAEYATYRHLRRFFPVKRKPVQGRIVERPLVQGRDGLWREARATR
jgi:hypothetical protein